MKEYNSLIAELDNDSFDLISEDANNYNSKSLENIKNRFYKKTTPKRKIKVSKMIAIAASLSIFFIGSINMNTSFAAKLLDIPIIGSITEWVTLNKIELYDEYREINIVIPTVEGLADSDVQEQINLILKDRSMSVYNKAVEASDQIQSDSEQSGFITSMPELVTQTYTLLRNDTDLLSFSVVTTEIKASAYETVFFYNIDLNNNKLLSLKDLFKINSAYIEVINNEIMTQMTYANLNNDTNYFIDEFSTVGENTSFYIDELNKLVVVFNEYEVAAGYMGMPEFTIKTELFFDAINNNYLK